MLRPKPLKGNSTRSISFLPCPPSAAKDRTLCTQPPKDPPARPTTSSGQRCSGTADSDSSRNQHLEPTLIVARHQKADPAQHFHVPGYAISGMAAGRAQRVLRRSWPSQVWQGSLPQWRCGWQLPPKRSAAGAGSGGGSSHPGESWEELSRVEHCFDLRHPGGSSKLHACRACSSWHLLPVCLWPMNMLQGESAAHAAHMFSLEALRS